MIIVPRRVAFAVLFLAIAALAAGCSREPHVVADLAERFPVASLDVDEPSIEVGTPQAEPFLAEGFSFPERTEDGTPFAWSVGDVSQVRFHAGRVRTLPLRLRCRPFEFEGAPPQSIEIELNRQAIGKLALSPERIEYELVLPASHMRVGTNEMSLRYAWTRAPAEVLPGVADRRPIAVRYERIRIGERDAVPRVAEDGRTLRIPHASRVRYRLRVPPGAELALPEIAGWGAIGGLSARVHAPDGRQLAQADLPVGRAARLPLPDETLDYVALELEAVPRGESVDGGIELTGPVVRSAEPPEAGVLPTDSPNVVIYLIDALRRDHLGAYGYPRPTSPAIDRFAARAVVFDDARAVSSWTKPTVATIFTGLSPHRHGVEKLESALPNAAVVLPELLHAVGYETVGFSANPNVTAPFGFDQGFVRFEDAVAALDRSKVHDAHGPAAHPLLDYPHEKALEWLLVHRSQRPFFLYVHTIDPHSPYQPEPEYLERITTDPVRRELSSEIPLEALQNGEPPVTPEVLRDLTALYDGAVAQNDAYFGWLMAELERLGLAESTLVVVISDHGEAFFEHGYLGHGNTLYDEVLRIPLLIGLPGQDSQRRIEQTIGHEDLLPTLAGLLGLRVHQPVDGRDWSAALRGSGAPESARPFFARLRLDPFQVDAVADGGWKLIREVPPGETEPVLELFELSRDPAESRNEIHARPDRRDELLRLIEAQNEMPPLWEPETGSFDGMLERLRALGYVE